MDVQLGVISQEQLKIEVKLLLSTDRKSYMPRRLAQQRMTLSDLEWSFYASRAISAVAELLDFYRASICEGGLGSRNSVRPSVCPSVCPSVTRVHCDKTK